MTADDSHCESRGGHLTPAFGAYDYPEEDRVPIPVPYALCRQPGGPGERHVIHGVSLITAGVKARGHELHTDATTLQQMEACARTAGKIPVKLNHQSGIEKVCGYVDNVRREGVKLQGD